MTIVPLCSPTASLKKIEKACATVEKKKIHNGNYLNYLQSKRTEDLSASVNWNYYTAKFHSRAMGPSCRVCEYGVVLSFGGSVRSGHKTSARSCYLDGALDLQIDLWLVACISIA